MSPTRRDILKLSAGTVAAALTTTAAGCRFVEPGLASSEPAPARWKMTAPILLEASDGRHLAFLPHETHTLVHRYDYLGAPDHETIVIEGEDAERLYSGMCAIACRMAEGLTLAQ